MAIEKVKKAFFLVQRDEMEKFVDALADSRTTHVMDLRETSFEGIEFSSPASAAAAALAEDKIHKLARVRDVFDTFAKPKRSLAENFVTVPLEMTRDEFEAAVASIDVDSLYTQITAAAREHANTSKKAAHLRARIKQLEPWQAGRAPSPELRRFGADLGLVPEKSLPALLEAAEAGDFLAVRRVDSANGKVLVEVVWLIDNDAQARETLALSAFESLGIPAGRGSIADSLTELRSMLEQAKSDAATQSDIIQERAALRRNVTAALAHWESQLEQHRAFSKAIASSRIVILGGYVRVRQLLAIEKLMQAHFPSAALVLRDPTIDDDVPVSLGGSRLVAPAQFLTSMFGLPSYFGFDPSPFIFFTFLLFFGICFGDVLYGAILLGLGLYLAKKSGENRGLARLFSLLALGGFASIIVGVLTNSWAADLLSEKYLGEGNPISIATARLAVFDPMAKPVVGLLIALGIGMFNQFYAISLLFYREWRKGRRISAVLDGGLWLLFLPALLVLLISSMFDMPAARTISLWLVGAGAVGLVLTQGRHEKTFLAKALTGIVSLYGIVGTYGTTSFIGDTLSYSRLLALGLTTTVIAQSWNLICGMLRSVPVLGILLFILVVPLGHVFNLVISALGAFVHSLRLIFVEFFTKFYETGGKQFTPLGAPKTVRVIEE